MKILQKNSSTLCSHKFWYIFKILFFEKERVKIHEIFTLWKMKVIFIKKKKKTNKNYLKWPPCVHTFAKSPGPHIDAFVNCFQWYMLQGFNNTRFQRTQIGVNKHTRSPSNNSVTRSPTDWGWRSLQLILRNFQGNSNGFLLKFQRN